MISSTVPLRLWDQLEIGPSGTSPSRMRESARPSRRHSRAKLMPRLRRPFGGAEIAAWILDAPNSACCGDLAHELTIIFVFFNDVGTRSSWRCSILCRRTYLAEFRRQRARRQRSQSQVARRL